MINIYKKINYLIFLVLIAIVYGGYIYNFPQESVTFAKTFLGYYDYNFTNEWFQSILDSPITLQIYLPYALLKIGLSDKLINFLFSSLTCLISFYAIYILSFIISKSQRISLFAVLLFLFHRFVDTHWYGLYYPVSYFYFGQMGMYLTIISSSLYFKDSKNLPIFFLILNLFSHAAWGVFNILFLFLISLLKKSYPKLNYLNLSFFILIFILMILVNIDYVPFKLNIFSSFQEYISDNNINIQNKIGYQVSHTPFFNLDKGIFFFIFSLFRFFFYEFLLLFLYLVISKDTNNSKIKLILKTYVICSFLIIFYYFLNNLFDINNFFSVLHSGIPSLLNRMLINRFLNINNIFILIFSFSYLSSLIFKNNSTFLYYYIVIYLIAFICMSLFFSNVFVEHLPIIKFQKIIYNSFIWINYPILIIYIFLKRRNFDLFKKCNLNIINVIFLLVILFFLFFLFPKKYFFFKKFTEENNLIFNEIDNRAFNEIIVGPLIYGYIDPSYLSDSPITLAGFNIYGKTIEIDLWCKKNQGNNFLSTDYYNYIYKDCFEKRTKLDWSQISDQLNIKYLLVRDFVHIDAKLIKENSFIKLYDIR